MKTVLVIEDNPDNMKLITFVLEREGFATRCAMTGKEGIEQALTDQPDFILLDIQLPDMDGTDVLRAIREDARGRDLPVVAVTSCAMSGDRERLLAAGCNGYIEKPIDPGRVVEEIRAILEERP